MASRTWIAQFSLSATARLSSCKQNFMPWLDKEVAGYWINEVFQPNGMREVELIVCRDDSYLGKLPVVQH